MINEATALGGTAQIVPQAMDELLLCRRIAGGERQLFSQIIDRYTSLVAGVLVGQGVPPADVEDLAQEAFINVYKGLSGFRGDAKLSSWIYRITVNIARQHLRRLAIKPRSHSVEEAMEAGVQPVDARTSGAPPAVIQNRALSQAMAQLPTKQRTALSLYYLEELSYEEIAEAMQLNLNTVRTQIRRGKLKLAQLLDASVLD